MSLELGASGTYKEFRGLIIEQMPLLIGEGLIPLGVRDIFERRTTSIIPDWLYNSFYTGDGFAYHPDGRVKIVVNAQPLREVTPDSSLNNGGLVLDDTTYSALEGQEFSRRDLKHLVNWGSTLDTSRQNPVLLAFMHGDQSALDTVLDTWSRIYRSEMSIGSGGIYIGISMPPKDSPIIRAATVGNILYGGGITGHVNLNAENAPLEESRLVGKMLET